MELPLKINNFDRFSNIPDNIIHTILSIVHIRYIARMGSLSKRLRQLCLSVPYLNVDIEEFEDNHKLDCFSNFMDKYWALRNGTELLYLHIRLPSYKFKCDMDFHVTTWIDCATTCHVQELDLDVAMNKPFYLSSWILNGRLRVLKLDLYNGVLMFPKAEFVSLQNLSLKSFKTVDFPLGEWILLYCKAIKRLNLEAFMGIRDLAITSSSLEDIKILTSKTDNLCHIKVFAEKLTTITIRWWNKGYFAKSFTIFAPNLVHLTYGGDSACYLCQGEFKSLVTAKIIVRRLSPDFPNRRDTIDSFKKFFWLLNKAKSMLLTSSFVQMLCEQDYAPTMSLKNLRYLKVYTGDFKEWVRFPALASFLKGSPNLRDLRIRHPDVPYISSMVPVKEYSFDKKCWESAELTFVQGLKVVVIEQSGDDNEVELIEYLLKHAKELEKITIFYSPQGPSNVWKKIQKKVEALKKASSNAGVCFHTR